MCAKWFLKLSYKSRWFIPQLPGYLRGLLSSQILKTWTGMTEQFDTLQSCINFDGGIGMTGPNHLQMSPQPKASCNSLLNSSFIRQIACVLNQASSSCLLHACCEHKNFVQRRMNVLDSELLQWLVLALQVPKMFTEPDTIPVVQGVSFLSTGMWHSK